MNSSSNTKSNQPTTTKTPKKTFQRRRFAIPTSPQLETVPSQAYNDGQTGPDVGIKSTSPVNVDNMINNNNTIANNAGDMTMDDDIQYNNNNNIDYTDNQNDIVEQKINNNNINNHDNNNNVKNDNLSYNQPQQQRIYHVQTNPHHNTNQNSNTMSLLPIYNTILQPNNTNNTNNNDNITKTTTLSFGKHTKSITNFSNLLLAGFDKGDTTLSSQNNTISSKKSTQNQNLTNNINILQSPLAIFEDVQLHISQLLFEAHLNTLYPNNNKNNQKNNTKNHQNNNLTTNFILSPDLIKNTSLSPWDRRDTIGTSITTHLLSQKDKDYLNNIIFTAQNSTNNHQNNIVMTQHASVYLTSLQRSVLCQDKWSLHSLQNFKKAMSQFQSIYFNTQTRTTKTAQKQLLSDLHDYIMHFFHPKEYLGVNSIFTQLLTSLSTSLSSTHLTTLSPKQSSLPNPTTTMLCGLSGLINSVFQPIQIIEQVITTPLSYTQQFKLHGNHQNMSVLHDVYEYIFVLLLLGQYQRVFEICLHSEFHNTPHFYPLLYLATMIIFNYKISTPLYTSYETITALQHYSTEIAMSFSNEGQNYSNFNQNNQNIGEKNTNMTYETFYHDELSALPRNPQDRFVYQTHLWRSQTWGNNINYKLSTTNKLFYILKFISGDLDDIFPTIYSTLYHSTTLSNNLYQPLQASIQTQLQERNLLSGLEKNNNNIQNFQNNNSNIQNFQNANNNSILQLTPEQIQFKDNIDKLLQERFLNTWGWLIALVFTLYHVEYSPVKTKEDIQSDSIFNFTDNNTIKSTTPTITSLGIDVNTTLDQVYERLVQCYVDLFEKNEKDAQQNSQKLQNSSTKNNLFFTIINFFAVLSRLLTSIHIDNNDDNNINMMNIDFTPLWEVFMKFSDCDQILFPLSSTLGLQRQLIISSLPNSFLTALGLTLIGSNSNNSNVNGGKGNNLIKTNALSTQIKRLLPTIVPSYQSNDATILQSITNAIDLSTLENNNNNTTTSPLLQSINLKWFTTQFLLQYIITLAPFARNNANTNLNNTNDTITLSTKKSLILPLDDSPVFIIQSIIYQYRDLLLSFKQWQWACYLTKHTIYQYNGDNNDYKIVENNHADNTSFPKAFLHCGNDIKKIKNEQQNNFNYTNFDHINDIWDILMEYISPIPHDEVIVLNTSENNPDNTTNGTSITKKDSIFTHFALPPCPDWLNKETYETLTYYLQLLNHLGISTQHLVEYYGSIKQLESIQNPNSHLTHHNNHLDTSLLFNSSLLNDSILLNKNDGNIGQLPGLEDDLNIAQFDQNGQKNHENNNQNNFEKSPISIIAQTIISGFQIGQEEINDVVQLLTILFILEQEQLDINEQGDLITDEKNNKTSTILTTNTTSTPAQQLRNHFVQMFKPTPLYEQIEQLFTPSSILELKNIIEPLQQFIIEYQDSIVGVNGSDMYDDGNGDNNNNNNDDRLIGDNNNTTANNDNNNTIINNDLTTHQRLDHLHNTSHNIISDLLTGMGEDDEDNNNTNNIDNNHNNNNIEEDLSFTSIININTNSLTDQWLIKYCHIPDIVITLARYLQSLNQNNNINTNLLKQPQQNEKSEKNNIQENNSKNKNLFSFFLMLKLEQQWTQHCINYINTPQLYNNFSNVFGLIDDVHLVYKIHFLNPNVSNNNNNNNNFTSFFSHIPLDFNISLYGQITTPTMLSLLDDLTTYTPEIVSINNNNNNNNLDNSLLSSQNNQNSYISLLLLSASSTTNNSSNNNNYNNKINIPVDQFFIQRYPIHTTFISTFSTYISPMLIRLSTLLQKEQYKQQNDNEKNNNNIMNDHDDNSLLIESSSNTINSLSSTYFQEQLTHLTCIYFLPQTNYWAECSQIIDPELYLQYIHTNINHLFSSNGDNDDGDDDDNTIDSSSVSKNNNNNNHQQQQILKIQTNIAIGIAQLIQLATRDAIEMIYTFTQYYIIGLIHRYITLTETIDTYLAQYIDTNTGELILFDENSIEQHQQHPIGVVCDSIDVLLGDIFFIVKVGNALYTTPILQTYIERLITVKLSLYRILEA